MPKSGAPELGGSTDSSHLCTLKNILFSLLFILPFFTVAWFGGSSTFIIYDANAKPNTVSIDNSLLTDEVYDANKGARFIIGISIMIIVSCLWAVLLLCITLYLGTRVVKFIFVLFILLAVFGGVIMFADESDELFGVILMLLAVVAVLFFLSVRNKLDFMGANLRVACAVVLASSIIVKVAVATLVGLMMWGMFWTIAVYAYSTNDGETVMVYQGITYHFVKCTTYFVGHHALSSYNTTEGVLLPSELVECEEPHGCSSCYYDDQLMYDGACFTPTYNSIHIVLFLLCFYYISVVLAHVVHCVSAAVAIKWWMQGTATALDILDGYRQACSRWLGPICIGSLLVPPVRTLYSSVHTLMLALDIDTTTGRPYKTNPSPHFVTLADNLYSLLKKLEAAATSYNRYAFSYLVFHDSQYDFAEASKRVTELFEGRGFTSLVHDTVLENILMLACMSSGILLMLLGILYITLVEDTLEGNINAFLPVCCFVISYLTSLLLLQVVLGAMCAIYVCLAENPDGLQTHHPEFFEPFVSAWRKHYPEANITVSTTACSFGISGGSQCSVDVFPTAYMPPTGPLKKMITQVSPPATVSASSKTSQRKQQQQQQQQPRQGQGQKYAMLRGNMSDCSDSDNDNDDVREKEGTKAQAEKPQEDLDAVLENYAASQRPFPPNAQLFSSPERANNSAIFDDDANEFVL